MLEGLKLGDTVTCNNKTYTVQIIMDDIEPRVLLKAVGVGHHVWADLEAVEPVSTPTGVEEPARKAE